MNCKWCGEPIYGDRVCGILANDNGLCRWCRLRLEKIPPLCGWEWFNTHKDDVLQEQAIQIYCDGKPIVHMSSSGKPGTLKKLLREMRGTGRR